MKKYLPAFILMVLVLACMEETFSQPAANSISTAAANSGQVAWRRVENKAFSSGEKLYYDVRWGLILAGSAELRLDSVEEINSRKAYHMVAESRSAPFFDVFYKVRNLDESWIDIESICSHKYQKRQRESGCTKEETTLFDHINRRFILTEKNKECEISVKEGSIPVFVQDILSAFYYVRTMNLGEGGEYYMDAMTGDRNYSLKVLVHGREKVSVPAGRFECFKIEPFIVGDGLFKAKGRLWIWVTADDRKIPVLMRTKISVGSVTASLTRMEPGR